MKLVVLGLSLSSSWGNGHATTYRALLRAAARLGIDVLFLERETPWYAANRDLVEPDYCRLEFYDSITDLRRFAEDIAEADAVMVGSYVPDGIAAGAFVHETARGLTMFYDIDTPVTLAAVDAGTCTYIDRRQIADYDLYLSFTGGPTLRRLEHQYGAPSARALYCSVDPEAYRPLDVPRRWDLGFLGTYSADRQPALERLLIEPARRCPGGRYVVVGAQFPDGIDWPENVERIAHLAPDRHAEFYSSLGWTLNLTRAAMIEAGFSPSVRLFESAACGVPIVSDRWRGMETALEPGTELVVADRSDDVLAALAMAATGRNTIAAAARARVLSQHTAVQRARQLAAYIAIGHANRSMAGEDTTGAARGAEQELTLR